VYPIVSLEEERDVQPYAREFHLVLVEIEAVAEAVRVSKEQF